MSYATRSPSVARRQGWTGTILTGLARLYPYDVEASSELIDALEFIESEHEPETIVRAGYGAGILGVLPIVPLAVMPIPLLVGAIMVVCLSLVCIHTIHSWPKMAAAFARTRALGESPNLIGLAVLRMQIQPTTEGAVRFAATSGSGPLAASLQDHIDASMGTPHAGLTTFADEWSDRFPALRRAAALLVTAQDAPEGERARTLDRALAAILDGTRNQMAEFTSAIRGPTTALYAFGVMLPLALVALVPALDAADFNVSIWFFVVLYNFVLPAGLVAASFWLLVRRPVAFPPPDVTRAHPEVPSSALPSLAWGIIGALFGYVLTVRYGPGSLGLVSAIGLGLGFFLVVYYRPIMLVRNYVKAVEEHLVDALYLTGRLVAEDEAVESAIVQAGERVPGETGQVFERASGLQRRLHLGVREAFHGEYGALRDIPSQRARSTANLLAIASEEGQPAGRAIVSMADHLEELQEVEAETKRSLATVTDTLDHTAAYFGPLVAGATVGLAGGIGGGLGTNGAPALPTDQLGLVVGVYVILLCFILVPLSISLKHGFDRSLVGYRVGTSLIAAIPIFVVTVVVVGMTM